MNIADFAKARYSTKAFDPERRIPQDKIDAIKTLIRFSPSSVNSQPWHFILATTDEGKQRIAKATQDNYAFNEPKEGANKSCNLGLDQAFTLPA